MKKKNKKFTKKKVTVRKARVPAKQRKVVKKRAVQKTVKKAAMAKKAAPAKPIGRVTHFFSGIKVAIVKFKKPVKIGTAVRIAGATTDFAQTITSMQLDHAPVKVAKKGKSVGIKVGKRVREGDLVYVVK